MESRRTSPTADFFIGGLTQEEGKHFIVWALVVCGALLVALSAPLAGWLANAEVLRSAYAWDAEPARALAADLRLLGILAFAAGLVERVVLRLADRADAGDAVRP